MYRAQQNQDESDSCVTSNVILWALIWRPWNSSFAVSISLIKYNSTVVVSDDIFEGGAGDLWVSPGNHTHSCGYQNTNPNPFQSNE